MLRTRRFWLTALCLFPLSFLAVAFAQSLDLPAFDPARPLAFLDNLAAHPEALGFLLFGLVASVKRSAENRKPQPLVVSPWAWRGFALGCGLFCALLLHVMTGGAVLYTTGWLGVLLFGLLAGGLAIIGRDGAKTALSWLAGSRAGTVVNPVIVGDLTPPAGVIEAPAQPIAPSGIEPLPMTHGLLGLPPLDLQGVVDQVLGEAFKGAVPLGVAGKFALKLAPVIPELLDGDLYLSAAGRNRILDVILDAKAGL